MPASATSIDVGSCETVEQVWHGFNRRFVELWLANPSGDAYPPALFEGEEGRLSLRQAQHRYMRELFEQSLGYAGCAMIRRTFGLAHNIDMEWIDDADRRAACERRNVRLAVELIKTADSIGSIEEVTAKAALIEATKPAG